MLDLICKLFASVLFSSQKKKFREDGELRMKKKRKKALLSSGSEGLEKPFKKKRLDKGRMKK